jgi:hypothetical protein
MSDNMKLPTDMTSVDKPVRWLAALAAAAVAAPAALAMVPGMPGWVSGAVGALGLILTAVVAKMTENVVTPWKDVAAKVTPAGEVVAGPAAEQETGTVVEVTPPAPTLPNPPMTDPNVWPTDPTIP